MGRMTLLASEDIESDDIYLYDEVAQSNTRVSVSTFGTPAGYLPSDPNRLLRQAVAFPQLVAMDVSLSSVQMSGVMGA